MINPTEQPPAIFLMGPTASGKTDLAVQLVEALPCDIISVDSAMVYCGMDIGTAKPDAELLARAPHRLIDIRDPSEPYSAAQFRDDALREMQSITAAGRIPLLVGGTMLYYRALQRGLAEMPSADPALRAQLEAEALNLGWPAMHRRLADLDPAAARRIHPNDPQRIQRALEVCLLSGRSMSDLHNVDVPGRLPYRLLKIALAPMDRAVLHQRIETRFDHMLEAGFVEEVRGLYERGDLDPGLPALRAVGYRQVWAYLAKKTTYPEMVQRSVIATRQLAKRQMTWLRSETDVRWLDSQDSDTRDTALRACRALLRRM